MLGLKEIERGFLSLQHSGAFVVGGVPDLLRPMHHTRIFRKVSTWIVKISKTKEMKKNQRLHPRA